MTQPSPRSPRVSAWAALVFVLSAAFLSVSFYTNAFRVASESLFRREITESYVMGRLVKSRQDGIFSSAGLLGHGAPGPEMPPYSDPRMQAQYQAYLEGITFESFQTYDSQIGGQGMLLSAADRVMPGSPETKIEVYRAVSSVLTAVVLSLIVAWFYVELGALVGLFTFGSLALASWLLAFAHNLFWSLWSFYLPMVVLLYRFQRTGQVRWDEIAVFLIFGTVLLKCFLNGYEFITTFLIMLTVPLVYFRLRGGGSAGDVVRDLTKAAVVSISAVVTSMAVLVGQIAVREGSLTDGFAHIVDSVRRRTYADPSAFPEVADDLRASLGEVLEIYVMGPFLNLAQYVYSENAFIVRWVLEVRYVTLIGLFAIATAVLARRSLADAQVRALVLATWFSALAPLSWFVVFKAHSFEHPHMNFIVWQMPFTIFGFAVCGLALRELAARVTDRFRARRAGVIDVPA